MMISERFNKILSEEDCKKVLLVFDKNRNLLDYKVKKYSEHVIGFLAEHYLLTITSLDKTDSRNSIAHHRFFLKSQPLLNEKQNSYIKKMDVFWKEILMYQNLISEFVKLISKPFAPKYYFSKMDECMVIEDVSEKNYEVCKKKYLGPGEVKGALKALARFHAASIIFEEVRSTSEKPYRIKENFVKELKQSTFSFEEGHVRNMWCHTATKCLTDLSRFFTDNCEVPNKIEKYIFSDKGFRTFIEPSSKYRNVTCHDDLWVNNMMFNEDEECLLLDFQLTKYAPPVFDVLLLLNLNLEEDFLKENFHSFLDIYYSYLKSELALHDIDIDNILSKSSFLESIEDYKLPALIQAALFGTTVYLPSDTLSVMISNVDTYEEFLLKNRSSFVMKDFQSDDSFRKRFSNVLRPLYKMFEFL